MKVQVPFDFNMDERFGIALAVTGELRLATREECRDWVHDNIAVPRAHLRGTVQSIKKQFEQPTSVTSKEE